MKEKKDILKKNIRSSSKLVTSHLNICAADNSDTYTGKKETPTRSRILPAFLETTNSPELKRRRARKERT
jgi:hypothetical protein